MVVPGGVGLDEGHGGGDSEVKTSTYMLFDLPLPAS